MIRKALAFLLALCMLFTGYAAEASLEEKLMEEIYNCAVYINAYNEAQTIALGEVVLFRDQKDYGVYCYDRLLIAEASLDFVIKEYANYKKKMSLLSVDEYLELMLSGVGVSDILMIYDNMDENYEVYLQYMKELRSYIRGDIWFEPYSDYVYDMAQTLIGEVLRNQRIQCLSLNYLLTQLSDQEAAEETWRRIFDDCVLMSNQSMSGYERNPQKILDEIEWEKEDGNSSFDLAVFRLASHLQYADFILGEFEKGDPIGQKYVHHFDDGNVWFPMADWMRAEDAAYEYMLEIETEDGILYGEWTWTFDEEWTWKTCQYAPTEIMIVLTNVGMEEVLAYADSAAKYGYTVSVTLDGGEGGESGADRAVVFVEKDGENISVIWTPEETNVFFLPLSVSLVPFRYMELDQTK